MSFVDQISAVSAGTGAASSSTVAAPATTLGQDSFLQLLTAQLRNQNPLDPLQNSEFIGQMAQFSTVSGINRINDTLETMSASGTGVGAVAALIGRQALVASPQTRADAAGTVAGQLTLGTAASAVTLTYTDTETGTVLHSQSLGPTAAGATAFDWTDPALAGRRITVSALAETAGGAVHLLPSTYAKVIGGSPATASAGMTLEIEDHGRIAALSVQSLR